MNNKDQEFICKEEFIIFCMNEILVLRPMLKFYSGAEFNSIK